MEITVLSCPYCGAGIKSNENVCQSCDREYIISSFSSLASMEPSDIKKYINSYMDSLRSRPDDPEINFSAGTCYLKLKMYEKAFRCFDKSIDGNFENSEAYYLAAISLLGGKKAFLNSKVQIDKSIEYVDAAIMTDDRAAYHCLMAYLKYDYYKKKFLKIEPGYEASLADAYSRGLTSKDIKDLFELLNDSIPNCFIQ